MNDERPAFDGDATEVVLHPGQLCFGRYRLKRELGQGGLGVVWLAMDEKLSREMALKFLRDHVRTDPLAIEDLRRETSRSLDVTHENIVRVLTFMEDERSAAIVMEYVPGENLAQRLAARSKAKPPRCFEVDELEPLVSQLCRGMSEAHAKGLVHRDLKPGNLLVTDNGRLKIGDLGIARKLFESTTQLLRDKQAPQATPSYASPQQLGGGEASFADDVYSLGATLYCLLAGAPPFAPGADRKVPETMRARRQTLRREGSPIPAAWEETILACLASEPAKRPRSVKEIARRLGIEVAGWPEPADDPDKTVPVERVAKAPRSRPRKISAGVGLIAAGLLAVLAIVFWPGGTFLSGAKKPNAKSESAGEARSTAGAPIQSEAAGASPREFTVLVDPPGAGARLWLGRHADLAVPADGRARLADLTDQEHELTVQAPGYQTLTTRVTVRNGRGMAEVKLVPVKGAVEITARPGTIVTAVDPRGREIPVGVVPQSGMLVADKILSVDAYTFRLAHSDCALVEVRDVGLAANRSAKVAPRQVPLPGELRIFSLPAGAEVWIGGAKLGVTPATLAGQPSEIPLNLEVFLRGYRRAAQTITLKPKEQRTVDFGALVAENGAIQPRTIVHGRPVDLPGVKYFVDGREIAPSGGIIFGLAVGSRRVEIVHPDYESAVGTTVVKDGVVVPADFVLMPKPGVLALTVNGPREYSLQADGKPVVVSGDRVLLPAGQSLGIEIAAKGFRSSRRVLTLPANGTLAAEFTLEPEVGSILPQLSVRGRPVDRAGAKYFIGDREVTLSNGLIAGLATGETLLEARHPDYEPGRVSVTVKDRDPTPAAIALLPKPGTLVLNVAGPSNYNLSVNGRAIVVANGRASLPAAETLMLEVTSVGYVPQRRALTLPANGEEKWEIRLERARRQLVEVLSRQNDDYLGFAPVAQPFPQKYADVWAAVMDASKAGLFRESPFKVNAQEGWVYGKFTGYGSFWGNGVCRYVVMVSDMGDGTDVQVVTEMGRIYTALSPQGGIGSEVLLDPESASHAKSVELSRTFLNDLWDRVKRSANAKGTPAKNPNPQVAISPEAALERWRRLLVSTQMTDTKKPVSLQTVFEAVTRGETVGFNVKELSVAVGTDAVLIDGVFTVSKSTVTFRNRFGHGFSVAPDKLLRLNHDPRTGSLGLQTGDGGKRYLFHDPRAEPTRPSTNGLPIICPKCDQSMSVLYALLCELGGRKE